MQAVLKESFAIKTLQAVQAQHGPVDLGMLERTAHALELLGRLVDSGVDLVFKGGTSLILRLQTIRRLSIDVDIICNWPREKLDPVLREIGRKPPFLDFEEHVRRKDSLPARRHYKFYFKSVVDGNRLPILLDVLEEDNPYGNIEPISMENPFFKLDHPIQVRVPTVDQLLGDKLTAFAPRTVGILFNPEATTQIAKQLFDVGELFTVADNLTHVRDTFDRVCQDQIGYRGNKHTREQVLEDTFNVSLAFCRHGLAKERDTDVEPCRLLEDGIGKMANYLVGSRFGRDESKIAASRAALLCHLLRIGECSGSLLERRFGPAKQEALGQIQIQWPHAALNKLISTTPEAFYYWAQIIKDLPGRKPSSSKWSQRGGQP